jgi:hypothetical protein
MNSMCLLAALSASAKYRRDLLIEDGVSAELGFGILALITIVDSLFNRFYKMVLICWTCLL